MINQVTLLGNLGKDPEIKTLENGTKVASMTVATSESYKDKSDEWQTLTEWHNVVVWRPSATVEKLSKGDKVFIQGKITTRKYSDKEGVERYRTEIVANTVKGLEPKPSSNYNEQAPPSQNNQVPEFLASLSDELPF